MTSPPNPPPLSRQRDSVSGDAGTAAAMSANFSTHSAIHHYKGPPGSSVGGGGSRQDHPQFQQQQHPSSYQPWNHQQGVQPGGGGSTSSGSSHHPILRVASAHGSRDYVHLLPLPHHGGGGGHIHQQQKGGGGAAAPSQQMASPPRDAAAPPVGGNSRLSSDQGVYGHPQSPQTTNVGPHGIPSPPHYQQAMTSSSSTSSNFGLVTRKSPESRVVQAVQPFFGLRESSSVIPVAADIPDELQVVKQLVRELGTNQLIISPSSNTSNNQQLPQTQAIVVGGNSGTTNPSSALGQNPAAALNALASPPAGPPPAYSSHHQRALQHQQQQKQASVDSQYSNTGQLMTGGQQLKFSGGHQETMTSFAGQSANVQSQMMVGRDQQHQQQQNTALSSSPTNNLRLSLSHSDLSKLQTISLTPQGQQIQQSQQGQQNCQQIQQNCQQQQQQQHATKMHPLLAAQQQIQQTVGGSAGGAGSTLIEQQQQAPQGDNRYFDVPQTLLQSAHDSLAAYNLHNSQQQQNQQQQNLLQFLQAQRQHHNNQQHPNLHNSASTSNFDYFEHTKFNVLIEENAKLRMDLEVSYKKALKLQQLELQYQKISRDYEDLVRKQEKRDQLEQQMQKKMQMELATLTDLNGGLNEQLDLMFTQNEQYKTENMELRQEIANLVAQNEEFFNVKTRQDVELEAQRVTLEEQRGHIAILDKALSNSQEKNVKLEEECKKRNIFVQRCEQQHQEIQWLREALQKREELYKRNSAQLQQELAQLKLQKKENFAKKSSQNASSSVAASSQELLSSLTLDDPPPPTTPSTVTAAKLKRELHEKEQQILTYQQESEQWQKMYNEELQRRESAVDELNEAKNARIKILEESGSKAEKRIEELENKLKLSEATNNILKRHAQMPTSSAAAVGLTTVRSAVHDSTYENPRSALSSGNTDTMDDSKKRLEYATRMLKSPSLSTYRVYAGGAASGLLHHHPRRNHKFTSIDSSFATSLDAASSSTSAAASLVAAQAASSTNATSAHCGGGVGGKTNDYGSLGRKSTASRHLAALNSAVAETSNKNFMKDSVAAAAARHLRAQSSCEAVAVAAGMTSSSSGHVTPSYLTSRFASPAAAVAHKSHANAVSSSSSYVAAASSRELTLPSARRSRNKLQRIEQGKLNRPRSADDHLFSRDDEENANNDVIVAVGARMGKAAAALMPNKQTGRLTRLVDLRQQEDQHDDVTDNEEDNNDDDEAAYDKRPIDLSAQMASTPLSTDYDKTIKRAPFNFKQVSRPAAACLSSAPNAKKQQQHYSAKENNARSDNNESVEELFDV